MKSATSVVRTLASRAVTGAVGIGALVGAASCSVDVLPEKPAVANTCRENSDCGTNGVCTSGACYSRTGSIDEVFLEVVPEASSPLSGISLLSMQGDLRRGAPSRAITLPGPISFAVQVVVNGEDLQQDCPYLKVGKQSVAARVQFTRVGTVGGIPVAGLSGAVSPLTVTTEKNASTGGSFNKPVSLVPGLYDVYAQPVASNNCQIPSKMWRGVEFALDGFVVAGAPPVTLELPKPHTLNGRVQRTGGTLADWQVDIIDPQEGKVISSSARLGATTEASPTTNFEIFYQPLGYPPPATRSSTILPGTDGPLIRLKPPKEAEGIATAPTLYFDLERTDLNNTGQVDLNVSKLPTSTQLVTVSGQVQGNPNEGVKTTVKFFAWTNSLGLPTPFQGLNAAYGPSVTTDASGRYSTKLFPGVYRIVVVPEGASDDGSSVAGANPARSWALTEVVQTTIGTEASQTVDIAVTRTRTIEGVATAGATHAVAQGATFEAIPPASSSLGVLRTVITPPISPAGASVPVDDTTGKYSLVLDPGYYDFVLKPAQTSKFAWWILPSRHVLTYEDAMGQVGKIDPELLYPVPFGGTISVTTDKGPQVLRNATVRAYARTRDNIVQVGTARTDDMGRYQLALPPDWGL